MRRSQKSQVNYGWDPSNGGWISAICPRQPGRHPQYCGKTISAGSQTDSLCDRFSTIRDSVFITSSRHDSKLFEQTAFCTWGLSVLAWSTILLEIKWLDIGSGLGWATLATQSDSIAELDNPRLLKFVSDICDKPKAKTCNFCEKSYNQRGLWRIYLALFKFWCLYLTS